MVAEEDQRLALAPHFVGGGRQADCHPAAWEHLCRLAARPGARIGTCVSRTIALAKLNEWVPIPHHRTLCRRVKALRALPAPAHSLIDPKGVRA